MQKENKVLIDSTNINEKVYQLLKHRIVYCEYPPGYKLSIRKLQDELGVSNSPIKDALFRLAGENFVDISSRKGSFVKKITFNDVLEIEQSRVVIETGAVRIVAEKITDSEILHLDSLYKNTLFPGDDFDYIEFIKKDFEFHEGIIKLTKIKRLLDIYRHLNAHLQIARYKVAHNINNRLPWTDSDHFEILQSFRERDPQKAMEAVSKHREKAIEFFLNSKIADY